jgi:hypothetical protein
MKWTSHLNPDPLPWLLEEDNPSIRYFALRDLLGRGPKDAELIAAKAAIMDSGPIKAIMAERHPDGYWQKPGARYSSKYTGTLWQIMFLADLGADASNPDVRQSCEYMLRYVQVTNGGFSYNSTKSGIIHCLNGNLTYALLALGYPHNDERIQQALDWQARAVIGDGATYYASGTPGPLFACVANGGLSCAWGDVKALKAFTMVPPETQTTRIQAALEVGVEFLLSRNLRIADYPSYNDRVSPNWFKFGYPLGYTSDILEALEVLAKLGRLRDLRLADAIEFMLSKQDENGRWKLEYTLNGKTWTDIERKGEPSKWITLRAMRILTALDSEAWAL